MENDLRPVVGYEGLYSVTEDGRIWSHTKKMRGTSESIRTRAARWMKPGLSPTGYPTVNIRVNGKLKHLQVHRAVAKAWIINPNPDRFDQVNHKDGNKLNNCASNLEWCDQSLNNKHAYLIGLKVVSDKVRAAMSSVGKSLRHLTIEQATEIRSIRAGGEPVNSIARKFGVRRQTVSRICNNRTYKESEQCLS